MAKRRMISLDVYDTDDFIEMLAEVRDLYTQLLVRSDDDGFNGKTKSIMRMFGAGEDALKTLIAKGFVLEFANGVIVISDWATQNTMRKDRYQPTKFIQERNLLQKDENGKWQPRIDAPLEMFSQRSIPVITMLKRYFKNMSTTWQPDGNQLVPQYRLGKDSIGKFSTGQIKDEEEEEINKSLTREREFPNPEQIFENTPQIEQLSLKLLSDFMVDSPEQASICIEALSGQYWRLRRLKDEGNSIVVLKEQAYGIDKGILNIIEEAAKYSLEHTKERLNDFNSFGSYFSTGLINKINTAISSGGNNDATV